ncbi:MAG: PQQ-binding-like beta-propeller repeat protein, partial [Planctomycetota bacterium]
MIPRMEPKRPLTLLGCALALLQACSDPPASPAPGPASEPSLPADWPIYRGNQALQGVAPGSMPERPELAWTFETGGAITSSPVVADGTVYVGSDDGSVHAVWLASGKKRWSYATGDIIEAPPLVLDGRVYVGSSDFFLYALDATTGKLAWKQETDDRILGGANWVRTPDGVTRILVGSYDNKLHCFDADSG